LEAGRHGETIGKDLIAVEMDRTGYTHCSHYSEDGAEVILAAAHIPASSSIQ